MPAVAAATWARARWASAPSRSRVAWAVSFPERSVASMPAWIAESSSMRRTRDGRRGDVPAGPAPRCRSFRVVPRRRAGSAGRAGGPSGDIDAMEGAVPSSPSRAAFTGDGVPVDPLVRAIASFGSSRGRRAPPRGPRRAAGIADAPIVAADDAAIVGRTQALCDEFETYG